MSQAEDPEPPHPPPSDKNFTPPIAMMWGAFLGVAAAAITILAASGAPILTFDYWGSDRSSVLRNLGLVIIAVPALWLAWSRTRTATKQASIAERGLQIDRFQKGSQMLGDSDLYVRIAGIQTLRELASTNGEEYYLPISQLLASFAANESKKRDITGKIRGLKHLEYEKLNVDAIEAIRAISSIRLSFSDWRKMERSANQPLVFEGANFFDCNFIEFNLSNCEFRQVNLSYAQLRRATLIDAKFFYCNFAAAICHETQFCSAYMSACNFENTNMWASNLTRVRFGSSNLKDAQFDDANISGASFMGRKVAKEELQYAWAWLDTPPFGLPADWGIFWQRFSQGRDNVNRLRYDKFQKTGEPEGVERLPWSPVGDG